MTSHAKPLLDSKGKGKAAAAASLPRRSGGPLIWRVYVQLVVCWNAYLGYLETHPVLTKSLTAAVISILSDLLAQWMYFSGKSFAQILASTDWTSVRNQAIIGFFVRGLPVHYWYMFLTRLFRKYEGTPARSSKQPLSPRSPTTPAVDNAERGDKEVAVPAPRTPLWVAAAKVFVDQTTYGPLSNWIYFYVIAAFNGVSLAATHAKVAREFLPLLIDNWKVWPLVTLVNFTFVPPKLQVLFGNVISIFWTAYVVAITR